MSHTFEEEYSDGGAYSRCDVILVSDLYKLNEINAFEAMDC